MNLEIQKKRGKVAILEKKNVERRGKRDNRKQKKEKCNSKIKRSKREKKSGTKKERERERTSEGIALEKLRSPAAALMLCVPSGDSWSTRALDLICIPLSIKIRAGGIELETATLFAFFLCAGNNHNSSLELTLQEEKGQKTICLL